MREIQKQPGPKNIYAPKIGIYAGSGSSHSFIWLAELFEKNQIFNVLLLDEKDILEHPLDFDFIIFSGGSPAQVANSLGKTGSEKIHEYIRQGGTYIGICAGTCLPLHSRKEPLSYFNWLKLPIANMSDRPPPAQAMPWKYMTPYGDDFVFHPVREDITITPSQDAPPFFSRPVTAPLYGGPPLMPPDSSPVSEWGKFTGFSKNTLFLADQEVARKILLQRAAVVQAPLGKGSLILFSPHLEHPRYPSANRVFLDSIICQPPRQHEATPDTRERRTELIPESLVLDLRRNLSNCRIRVNGLIPLSIRWNIGQKVYEPEKALAFLNAVWKRLPRKEMDREWPQGSQDKLEHMLEKVREVESLLKILADMSRQNLDTTETAKQCFDALRNTTRRFINLHIQAQTGV
jgi:hypothetical protein